jgi:exonuclease III
VETCWHSDDDEYLQLGLESFWTNLNIPLIQSVPFRLIAIKLNAEPVNVLIVQVYMPMSHYEDEEVEELHDRLEAILEEDGKGDTNTIIMGDWNSVVNDKSNGNICGQYGLGNRNKRGQMLIDFCERMGLAITNRWFEKPKRRL